LWPRQPISAATDSWCQSFKSQHLKSYERFADVIERHWHGIVAYCKSERKLSLGFIEGLNNKNRVLPRLACARAMKNRLKVVTRMLPTL
jgi:transposase